MPINIYNIHTKILKVINRRNILYFSFLLKLLVHGIYEIYFKNV